MANNITNIKFIRGTRAQWLAYQESADFKPLQSWQTILNELQKENPGMYAVLDGSKAVVNQGYILILAERELFVSLFQKQENALMLTSIIDRVLGGHYKVMTKKSKSNLQYLCKKEHSYLY